MTSWGCNQSPGASSPQGATIQAAFAPPAAKPAPATAPVATASRRLFMDMHELGKVSAKDVAAAHQKDLAVEGSYDVDYKAYWVDEQAGKIYCLVEAPDAAAATAVHAKAHGLTAKTVWPVTGYSQSWRPAPGKRLFLDVHHLGPGKASESDVAAAHAKDLAAQAKHEVTFLNYWFDAESGTVLCLSEAQDPAAPVAVHRDAHGLLPDSIAEVTEGR